MNLLTLENIKKSYILGEQNLEVLRGINLEIKQGDFVAIMGESGSGKSTLMNILGMLDTPTSGKYQFEKHDVSNLSDNNQSFIRGHTIGFIFQSYNLIPKMSSLRQVMTPLMYQGVHRKEAEERAIHALQRVGLGEKMYNLPTQMSGGEQQRVAIARAIVTNPPLILGDEPTGALDSKTGMEIMEIISSFHKEEKTIIIITHTHEVAKYAKKIIHIKDGLINSTQ